MESLAKFFLKIMPTRMLLFMENGYKASITGFIRQLNGIDWFEQDGAI